MIDQAELETFINEAIQEIERRYSYKVRKYLLIPILLQRIKMEDSKQEQTEFLENQFKENPIMKQAKKLLGGGE